MTRAHPFWLVLGFAIALIGIGFPYWRLPYREIGLPDSLYGPGLVAVAVVALMLRAFGTARFWKVWLIAAAAVPVAVLLRVAVDVARDSTSHNLWPLELAIAAAVGLAAALAGAALGSLLLLRSSRRPP